MGIGLAITADFLMIGSGMIIGACFESKSHWIILGYMVMSIGVVIHAYQHLSLRKSS